MNFDTPTWRMFSLKGGVIKMKKLLRFLKDEEGVTSIEYGLIAALLAVAIIVATTALGTSLSGFFNTVARELEIAAAVGS